MSETDPRHRRVSLADILKKKAELESEIEQALRDFEETVGLKLSLRFETYPTAHRFRVFIDLELSERDEDDGLAIVTEAGGPALQITHATADATDLLEAIRRCEAQLSALNREHQNRSLYEAKIEGD